MRQVTAIVENTTICPTHSAADVRRKITPPDVVSISSNADLKVIAALRATEPFFREPTEQKRDPATFKLDTIPGRGIVYVRWLIEGDGPVEVKLQSVKGGRDAKKAE